MSQDKTISKMILRTMDAMIRASQTVNTSTSVYTETIAFMSFGNSENKLKSATSKFFSILENKVITVKSALENPRSNVAILSEVLIPQAGNSTSPKRQKILSSVVYKASILFQSESDSSTTNRKVGSVIHSVIMDEERNPTKTQITIKFWKSEVFSDGICSFWDGGKTSHLKV